MNRLQKLFKNNFQWAQAVTAKDPFFFNSLEKIQAPKYLWIGCSDSRVPANEIIGLKPGEVFVHRNIGNVVVYSDLNCLSVIQFAVDVLKVSDILVVGHYNCGAVRAAETGARLGLVDNWINHIQDIRTRHRNFFNNINFLEKRVDALCELNVIEQVNNVAQTSVLNDAWERGADVHLHGLIYRLNDGILHDLQVNINNKTAVDETIELAINKIKNSFN